MSCPSVQSRAAAPLHGSRGRDPRDEAKRASGGGLSGAARDSAARSADTPPPAPHRSYRAVEAACPISTG